MKQQKQNKQVVDDFKQEIKKETKSIKWTALGFLIPTAIAFFICTITRILYDILTFII